MPPMGAAGPSLAASLRRGGLVFLCVVYLLVFFFSPLILTHPFVILLKHRLFWLALHNED